MPEVPEYVVNVKLAEVLSELGIDARAERIKGRRRPDIRCFYKGLIIGVEASYDRGDAERDAEARVEQGLVDIAIALHIKEKFRDVPEAELKEAIKKSRFAAKVFVPREIRGTLLQFIEKEISKKAESATEWFEDVDIPTIKSIIESSAEFLLREEEVVKLLEDVKKKIGDFVTTLASLDTNRNIRRGIYDILYRLYGLTIAEAEDPEIAFGHAALSVLLSTTFYEHIRSRHPNLLPVTDYVAKYGAIEGLRNALSDLLKIDYRVVVETTLNILKLLPPDMNLRVKDLVELGARLASNRSLLKKDFAGRIYHEITGDMALRKGFATFYTEVPAAYLLATLATQTLLDVDTKDILTLSADDVSNLVSRIKSVKVGDLACGSGTLLTASYSALIRLATMLKYYYNLDDLDLDDVGRKLVEEGIYGIDALRYASQITAINLALIAPGTISKENVFTIYLGWIPGKQQAWLGSLELLNNGKKVGGLLAYIEGGLGGIAEKVSVEGVEGTFSIPEKFDLIIMNPPFTRATGRSEGFGERRGLFGFIVEENIRENLIEAYERVRDRIRSDLRQIAQANRVIFPGIIQEIIGGRRGLDQYLSIGQAGEGLLFLYLAYRYVKPGGVIAFVLPRNLLAGVSWFLARVLLASKFHLKYVVVSSDSEKGYNFSEGTALSETLIVAKRVDNHSDDEETIFVNLLRKPSTALEAMMLAEEIKRASREILFEGGKTVSAGKATAYIFKVSRKMLLESVDNWNVFVATSDPILFKTIESLITRGEILVESQNIGIRIPITRFDELIEKIGIDAHQFHDHFRAVQARTAYPVVHGGGEEVRSKMIVRLNSYAEPRTNRADSIFRDFAGRILVPDRIWWETAHVTALYSTTPTLSNIFYAVKLKVREMPDLAEKALVLWLNTTWGLLTMLVYREETRGPWTRLKMGQWRLLPVLDVSKLDTTTLGRLAETFDKYADKQLRRIPEQFDPSNPDHTRLSIDMEFLKVFNPNIDDNMLKKALLDLYRHVDVALRIWIGK